jgi:hypothetical protein
MLVHPLRPSKGVHPANLDLTLSDFPIEIHVENGGPSSSVMTNSMADFGSDPRFHYFSSPGQVEGDDSSEMLSK